MKSKTFADMRAEHYNLKDSIHDIDKIVDRPQFNPARPPISGLEVKRELGKRVSRDIHDQIASQTDWIMNYGLKVLITYKASK